MNTCKSNEEVYAKVRKELLDRELSNSQMYDRAILTLSVSVLGISLAFINSVVPLREAYKIEVLVFSWILFVVAIISTICSFQVSQKAIKLQLEYAEEYYLKHKEKYLNKKNKYAQMTECINKLSGIVFILAIFLTGLFIFINI